MTATEASQANVRPLRLLDAVTAYIDDRTDENRQQVVRASVAPLRADTDDARSLEQLLRTVTSDDPIDPEEVLTEIAFLEMKCRPNGRERQAAEPPAPEDDGAPIDPDLLAAVQDAYGVTGPAAWRIAQITGDRIPAEQAQQLARHLIRDQRAAKDADLDAIDVVTADELLRRPRVERRQLLGDLVMVGHNVTVTARYKVGKSTLLENVVRSLATGHDFLGRYHVDQAVNVALLNYELDANDMELRVRAMQLDDAARARILVINLRGHRLPLMAPVGRDWLVDRLAAHGATVLCVDPFGAAYAAAGGESENDNAEVRRFVTALDEIKRLAGCDSLFMPVHTGRAEQVEGDERGRGATVLDDWADVRIILTKTDDDARYLRTEGRALDLHESRLGYQDGRLMLATTDVGLNRRKARDLEHANAVAELVKATPGINKRDLRDGLTGLRKDDRDSAVALAVKTRLVHVHPGPNRSQRHYTGPSHEGQDCPEGADLT